MRKFKIFTVFLIMALLVAARTVPAAAALQAPDIKAEAALLVEEKSGKILYEYGKDIRVAPGSIAKVMTLLLAVLEVEDGQAALHDDITASETFLDGLSEDTVTQKIKPGETMRYVDLMYCAFIASANDACNILAEKIGGTISGFVKLMNDKAEELGCGDTRFANPGGINDPGQYTSAWDQYLILKEAVRHPLFLEIAGTESYKIEADDDSPERRLINPNDMLRNSSPYYYKYSAAGKTATSSLYGSSLVAYAKTDELALISVVFGVKSDNGEISSSTDKGFSETIRLFEWGVSGFAWQEIVKIHETTAYEKIALAKGTDLVELRPFETLTVLVRNDLMPDDIKKDILIYGAQEGKTVTAPVKKGDVLGEMTVRVDGEICGRVYLTSAHDIELDRGAYIKSQISDTLSEFWVQFVLFILLVILGLYMWLVIRDFRARCAKRRRNAEIRKKIMEDRQRRKSIR